MSKLKEAALKEVLDDLIDEVALGVFFEVSRFVYRFLLF